VTPLIVAAPLRDQSGRYSAIRFDRKSRNVYTSPVFDAIVEGGASEFYKDV